MSRVLSGKLSCTQTGLIGVLFSISDNHARNMCDARKTALKDSLKNFWAYFWHGFQKQKADPQILTLVILQLQNIYFPYSVWLHLQQRSLVLEIFSSLLTKEGGYSYRCKFAPFTVRLATLGKGIDL